MTDSFETSVQKFLNSKGASLDPDGVLGRLTRDAISDHIARELLKINVPFDSIFNPAGKALVFLRTDSKLTNTFDDVAVLFLRKKVFAVMPCTTTPGHHWIFNPLTVGGITGTAIAVGPQFVRDSHTFVTSATWRTLWLQTPYFQQTGSIRIWRDGDKDLEIDTAILQSGWFGINFHTSGWSSFIDRWSAGCQVVPRTHWVTSVVPHFFNGEKIHFVLV